MSRALSRTALVSAVGLVAAGAVATGGVTAAANAGDEIVAPPPTVKVFITSHHDVRMRTNLRPGVHRFAISSGGSASFQVVKPRAGYTKAELSRDVNASLNATAQPNLTALKRFERNVTLLGGMPSDPSERGVFWVRLPAGKYFVADTNAHVQRASKILTVWVHGPRLGAAMPRVVGNVRAINEADWAATPKTIPTSGRLGFTNASEDNHFIDMERLASGKTMADFKAWIEKASKGEDAGPPPIDEQAKVLDTGVVSPGHRMVLHYSLPAGNYVMLCWWPDAEMGGLPHAFMGMYRGITVQ
jgi:hypothetical protein